MEQYDLFCESFNEHLRNNKSSNNIKNLDCRFDWNFDGARVINTNSTPHSRTYFKYCFSNKLCPVFFLIQLLKDTLNPVELIRKIIVLYNINPEVFLKNNNE